MRTNAERKLIAKIEGVRILHNELRQFNSSAHVSQVKTVIGAERVSRLGVIKSIHKYYRTALLWVITHRVVVIYSSW